MNGISFDEAIRLSSLAAICKPIFAEMGLDTLTAEEKACLCNRIDNAVLATIGKCSNPAEYPIKEVVRVACEEYKNNPRLQLDIALEGAALLIKCIKEENAGLAE